MNWQVTGFNQRLLSKKSKGAHCVGTILKAKLLNDANQKQKVRSLWNLGSAKAQFSAKQILVFIIWGVSNHLMAYWMSSYTPCHFNCRPIILSYNLKSIFLGRATYMQIVQLLGWNSTKSGVRWQAWVKKRNKIMPGRECIYEKEDYNLDRGQNTCFFVLKCSLTCWNELLQLHSPCVPYACMATWCTVQWLPKDKCRYTNIL